MATERDYSTSEAASEFGVTASTFSRWVREGWVTPSPRRPGVWGHRFSLQELNRLKEVIRIERASRRAEWRSMAQRHLAEIGDQLEGLARELLRVEGTLGFMRLEARNAGDDASEETVSRLRSEWHGADVAVMRQLAHFEPYSYPTGRPLYRRFFEEAERALGNGDFDGYGEAHRRFINAVMNRLARKANRPTPPEPS